MPEYGEDPHKLARRDDPETSHMAANEVDSATWERRVLEVISSYGFIGCVQQDVLDEIRNRFGDNIPYSTVTARFRGLEEKGLIGYTGETRQQNGRGRHSRVRVASEYL